MNKKIVLLGLALFIVLFLLFSFLVKVSANTWTASSFSQWCAQHSTICHKANSATVSCPSEGQEIDQIWVHAGEGQTIYQLPNTLFSYGVNDSTVTVQSLGQHAISWVAVVCSEKEVEPTPTPSPTIEPSPSPEETTNPSPSPTPNPKNEEVVITENSSSSLSDPSAPGCTDTDVVKQAANVHVYRKGDEALVKWYPTEGSQINIYYKQNKSSEWQYSVRNVENNGSYLIKGLGSLDITFSVQQVNGCSGGPLSYAIIDGAAKKWVLFR